MSIAQLRKYTDASAPQLTGDVYGKLTALLKAVLVDGYGSQAALGWTEVYSSVDTYTKAFMNEGSGTLLRVDNSSVPFGTAQYASVCAYESMTDIDNGISRCPTITTTLYWFLDNATSSDATPWMIIGDDKGFWFCVKPWFNTHSGQYDQMWIIQYVGDYIPLDVSNNNNFFITGNETATAEGVFGRLNCPDYRTSPVGGYWLMRGYDCEIGAVGAGLSSNALEAYDAAANQLAIGRNSGFSPLSNERFFNVPVLIDGANNKMVGFLPGLLNPYLHWGANYDMDDSIWTYTDEEYTLSDRIYHLLRYRRYNESYKYPSTICLVSGEGFRNVY